MSEIEKKESNNAMTSKERRVEREKERKKEKNEIMIWKIGGIVVGMIVLCIVVWGIVAAVMNGSSKVVASNDYSAELLDNGFVKDVKALDCVTLPDYKNLVISLAEVDYSDEEVDSDIENVMATHMYLSNDTDKLVEDGDTVNIDYVGYIDDVPFEGGDSREQGYDLSIGSHSFIDDFEEQLIGHGIGELVKVEVTFPENYGKEDLANKDAVFDVTIHGIYVTPELTDEFVSENFPEYASTVEEYRAYLKNMGYEANLSDYLTNYLAENTVGNKYPKEYLKNIMSVQKMMDQESFNYMNQMSLSYYGYNMYQTFEEYVGKTEAEYDKELGETCKDVEKEALLYQAILENEGMTVTFDEYKNYVLDMGATEDDMNREIDTYGTGFVLQNYVRIKALDVVKGYATVQ